METKQDNRLTYIDYLETIAMFCVVCCHYYAVIGKGTSANMYMLFMKCFGVPIFLLANGALMFQRKFSLRKHLKKNRDVDCDNNCMESSLFIDSIYKITSG